MNGLFRFPDAIQRDQSVDFWMAEHAGELGAIAGHWLEVLRSCGSDVRELLHDDHPTLCVGDAAFAYVDVFSAHVNVGFFRGAELDDSEGILAGTGKYIRHVKLEVDGDTDSRALTAMIELAYADMKARAREESE